MILQLFLLLCSGRRPIDSLIVDVAPSPEKFLLLFFKHLLKLLRERVVPGACPIWGPLGGLPREHRHLLLLRLLYILPYNELEQVCTLGEVVTLEA